MILYITDGFNVAFFIKASVFKKLKSYIEEKNKFRLFLTKIYTFKKLKSYIEEKTKQLKLYTTDGLPSLVQRFKNLRFFSF